MASPSSQSFGKLSPVHGLERASTIKSSLTSRRSRQWGRSTSAGRAHSQDASEKITIKRQITEISDTNGPLRKSGNFGPGPRSEVTQSVPCIAGNPDFPKTKSELRNLNRTLSAPNLEEFLKEAKIPLLEGHTREVTIVEKDARQESVALWVMRRIWAQLQKRIPILEWLPNYDAKANLRGDINGGIVIGVVLVCQTMAHAAIATTSPVQGPYCALAPAIIYALFGTVRHASISSGAVAAMLIAEQLEGIRDINERTHVASLLSLYSGAIIAILGLLKVAFLVQFMSAPCLSGFVSAAALIITGSQLKHFFGVSEHVHGTNGFFQTLQAFSAHIPDTNFLSLGIGIFSILGIRSMKNFKAKYGKTGNYQVMIFLCSFKELIVVVIGTLIMYLTRGDPNWVLCFKPGLSLTGAVAPTIGVVPQGLPHFRLPWDSEQVSAANLKKWHDMVPASFIIALTTYLTTYASSKRIAIQQGYPVKPNQEAIALGLAGIGGSFFGSFPPSGSLSRASLLPQVGIKTQVGGIVACIVVGCVLTWFSPALYYLPRASLAGVIIFATYGLQDFKYALWLWKYSKIFVKESVNRQETEYRRTGGLRSDLMVWLCAFIGTLAFGVVKGIVMAITLSFILLIRAAVKPGVVTLGMVPKFNMFRDIRYWDPIETYPGVLIIQIRAALFFGNVDYVRSHCQKIIDAYRDPILFIVLDASCIHNIDATALTSLKEMLSHWSRQGISCIMSHANGQVRGVFATHLCDLNQVTFYLDTFEAVNIARQLIRRRLEQNPGTNLFTLFHESEQKAAAKKIQRMLRASPLMGGRRRVRCSSDSV